MTRERSAWALAVSYFAAVATCGWLGHAHALSPADFASTPVGVLHGRVWTLFSSGLMVAGAPAVWQLLAAGAGAFVLGRLCGATTFWHVAVVGHVGSALLAYAALGLLVLAGVTSSGTSSLVNPDFGISCVWFATLGALLALLSTRAMSADWTTHRELPLAVLCAAAMFVPTGVVGDGLTTAEHSLAFVLGAIAMCSPARISRSSATLSRAR